MLFGQKQINGQNNVTKKAYPAILQSFLKDGLGGQFQLLTFEQVSILRDAIDTAYQTPPIQNQIPKEIAVQMLSIRRGYLCQKYAHVRKGAWTRKSKPQAGLRQSLSQWCASSWSYLKKIFHTSRKPDMQIKQTKLVEMQQGQKNDSVVELANKMKSKQSPLLLQSNIGGSCEKRKTI